MLAPIASASSLRGAAMPARDASALSLVASALARGWASGLGFSSNPGSALGQWQQQRSKSQLAFEELTAGSPTPQHPTASPSRTLLVLHGLLGCGRNWRTWARKLVEGAAASHPPEGGPWRVLLVDLRCHGDSTRRPGFHPPHSMRTAAEDVSQLIRDQIGSNAPGAVLGHSMGGKVALALLEGCGAAAAAAARQQQQPQQQQGQGQGQARHDPAGPGPAGGWCAPPRQLWVLDSQPGRVAAELDAHTGVSRVLREVQSVPLPIPSRAWLLQHLRSRGLSEALVTWLASSTAPAQPHWAQAPQNQQQQQHSHGHHRTHQGSSSHGHASQPHQPAHGHSGPSSSASQPLTWAFDIQGAGAMYMSYRMTEYWHVLEAPPAGTAVHLVQGARSDRWLPELQQRLLAAAAASAAATTGSGTAGAQGTGTEAVGGGGGSIGSGAAAAAGGRGTFERHLLEAAGHWLHVDNPKGLLQMVLPRLAGL